MCRMLFFMAFIFFLCKYKCLCADLYILDVLNVSGLSPQMEILLMHFSRCSNEQTLCPHPCSHSSRSLPPSFCLSSPLSLFSALQRHIAGGKRDFISQRALPAVCHALTVFMFSCFLSAGGNYFSNPRSHKV